MSLVVVWRAQSCEIKKANDEVIARGQSWHGQREKLKNNSILYISFLQQTADVPVVSESPVFSFISIFLIENVKMWT